MTYHLVMRCRRRVGNRPTRLPDTSRPSQRSHTCKHCRWRRRMRRLLLVSYCMFHGRNQHITPWRYKAIDSRGPTWAEVDFTSCTLEIGTISDETLTKFCENADFLSPVRLLKHFSTPAHAANAERAVARMNLLCCQADAPHAFKK